MVTGMVIAIYVVVNRNEKISKNLLEMIKQNRKSINRKTPQIWKFIKKYQKSLLNLLAFKNIIKKS